MYCENCGKEVKRGSKHCSYCGAPIKQRVPGKLIAAGGVGIALLLILIVVVVSFVFKKRTLIPENYIRYQIVGLSGEGSVSLDFDCQKLVSDIKEKKQLTNEQESDIYSRMARAGLQFDVSKSGNVANGDTIVITSELPKDILSDYKIVFKSQPLKCKIEGMTEITTVKIADYVNVTFSGFEGMGGMNIQRDLDRLRDDVEKIIYSVDNSSEAENYVSSNLDEYLYNNFCTDYNYQYELKTGDKIEIAAWMENAEITKYGVRFEAGTYETTVSGLAPIETIDLQDYVVVGFDGYDTTAKPQVTFNQRQLKQDIKKLFQQDNRNCYGMIGEDESLSDDDWSYQASMAAESVEDAWENFCVMEFDPDNGISEGDTISVSCVSAGNSDVTMYAGYGIYITGFEKEVKAEHLSALTHIDLSNDVSVKFSGICPEVSVDVTVNKSNRYSDDVSYQNLYSETITAELGDTYERQISYDEDALKQNGYVVDNATVRDTIEGLPTYNFTFEDLNSENLETLKEQSEQQAWSAVSSNIDQLGLPDGWLLRDQGSSYLKSGLKWYSQQLPYYSYYGYYSGLLLKWEMDIPFEHIDGSAEYQKIWYVKAFYGVVENLDGSLTTEDEDGSIFGTEEAADEWIEQQKSMFEEDVEETRFEQEIDDQNLPEIVLQTADPIELDEASQQAMHELLSSTSPQLPQNLSPANVISYNGHTYARFDEVMTWEDAEAFCENAGGHLVTISGWREQLIVSELISDGAYSTYWLGATDKDWEGAWKWVTNEDFDWTNWHENQPDNDTNEYDSEDYLTTVGNWDAQWNDSPNGQDYGFILELDPSWNPEEQQMLTKLPMSGGSSSGVSNAFYDPYGEAHYASVYVDASENGWVSYQLDGKWSTFGANLSTYADAGSGISIDIAIWGDGRLLYMKRGYQKTDAPEEIILSVEGIQKLTIMAYNRGEYNGGIIYLNEARLMKSAEQVVSDTIQVLLKDQKMIDSGDCEIFDGLQVDTSGNFYENEMRLNAASNKSIIWNLNGDYTELSGVFFVGTAADSAIDIQILADEECIFELNGFDKNDGIQAFSVDVTGKQILELKTSTAENAWTANLYIMGAYLTGSQKTNPIVGTTRKFDCAEELKNNAANVVTMGDYSYYRIDQAMTQADAQKYSEQMGGTLAIIHTSAEQKAISTLLSGGVSEQYWLGGQLSSEQWTWLDGSLMDYTNWAYNQPDNYKDEENAVTSYCDGTWNDINDKDNELGFVVQVKASDSEENGVNLSDLEWINSDSVGIWSMRDWDGKLHAAGIGFDTSAEGWMSVALNGNYSKLKASVQAQSNVASSERMTVAFFGDGKLLGEVDNCSRADGELPISIDVSGVSVLTVASKNKNSTDNANLYLNEAVLYQSEGTSQTSKAMRLSDFTVIDSVGMETGTGLVMDARDHLYGDYIRFDSSTPASVTYNLNRSCGTFSGLFTIKSSAYMSAAADIAVYVDEKLVYERKQLTKLDEPEAFSVDVSGARTLQITVQTTSGNDSVWVYLEENQLTQAE